MIDKIKTKFKMSLWRRIKLACGLWWFIVVISDPKNPIVINCADIEILSSQVKMLKKSLVPLREIKRLIKQSTNGSIKKAMETYEERDRLLKPSEVDALLGYPLGHTLRLARNGVIRYVELPDHSVRIREFNIRKILSLKDAINKGLKE